MHVSTHFELSEFASLQRMEVETAIICISMHITKRHNDALHFYEEWPAARVSKQLCVSANKETDEENSTALICTGTRVIFCVPPFLRAQVENAAQSHSTEQRLRGQEI